MNRSFDITFKGTLVVLAGLLGLVSLPQGPALAVNITYADGPGDLDFADGLNWVGGAAPDADDTALINGVDGVFDYPFVDSAVTIQRYTIAELINQSGGLEIRNGGVLNTTSASAHYVGARGVGHLRILDGAEMNLAGPLQVGWGSGGGHGNGTVTQDGGLFTSTSGITIGNSAAVPGDPNLPGSTGLYTLNNGTIELVGPLIAGLAGTGHFVMNGGSLETAAYLQIGRTGTGSFVQSAGDVAINRTSVDPAIVIASHAGGVGVYEISGGSLTVADTNSGVSVGSPTSTGTFRVVGDAATVMVATNYRQAVNSSLQLEIGNGISPIQVGENAFLDGSLEVSFSATPSFGDQFTIMTYGGDLAGQFLNFDEYADGPAGADSIRLRIDYGAGTGGGAIVLTVVPEPATYMLMAGFALAFALVSRGSVVSCRWAPLRARD